ncbi:MAG TPA: lysophospholipid acyltransferase family protein [Bryobacteraceae bacterium]|nr:lysophospholipid acyltransferase family protein [Bryobacteraceae bacterium]
MAGRSRSALRNWAEYVAVAGLIATLRYSPRSIAERLARFYVHLLDIAVPRYRRIARRNIQLAMPKLALEERKRIADGVFRSIARVLVGVARLPDLNPQNINKWIVHDGLEHLREAQGRGKGVLIATGHLGNWELSVNAHTLLCADTMNVVVRPLDNPMIDRFVQRRRQLFGNRMIGKKDFVRSLLKALQSGETVAMLVDQNNMLEEGVFVDFFGVPARTGTSFAKFAARTGAAVVPGFAVWIEAERRYRLKFYPLVDMTGDVEEDTRRVQAAIERAIREYPDQWLWIHRRWKARPEGAPDLY